MLTSMRTALVLLFLLALAAVPGSVLPQRPRNPSDVAGFYEQYPQLAPGETMTLPNGLGSITFTGFKEWAGLRVTEEPAKLWVLGSALVILAGLLLTLGVRRRRMWARALRTDGGRTVVEVGGLTRDTGRGFEDEFNALVERMRSRSGGPADNDTDSAGQSDRV